MSNQKNDMDVFFHPKSVAIIGASDSFKFGHTMTKYLLNSNFQTYPVNITKDIVFGHKVFKNINDIHKPSFHLQLQFPLIICVNITKYTSSAFNYTL